MPRLGSRTFTTARALQSDHRTHSVLKDPETNQIIETLSAQGIGLLMPNTEYIQTMPIGFDDPEKARFVSRLLQGILQSPGMYRTNFTTFKDGFIFGTAIQEFGWETKSRRQVVQEPVLDKETGMLLGFEPGSAEVVYRDAPLVRQVDIWDFYPDPSGTRIQENMIGCAKKFRISQQQALRMVEAGIYSAEGVRRAIEIASGGKKGDRDHHESERFPFMDTQTADKYKILTGFEFWGESPVSRPRNRVMTLLEGQHVRSQLNPFLDGNIPFKEVVLNPLMGKFYGLAVAATIRFLQDSTDTLLMLHTDAADLAVRPVLLAAHALGADPLRLQERRPNDVIEVNNPDMVKPLPSDLNALVHSAGELIRRKTDMREASGVTNPLQSIPSGGRQTATEISELVRLASQKVELMVQLVERDDYPHIGRTLHSRMRQFLNEERQSILAGERFPVTLQDIDFDADIRFVGVRQAQNQFQKAASLREAINVLGTNPGIISIMPTLIQRYLRDGLDIQDADEIMQEALQAIQQQQQQAQQQAAAEQMGNTAQGSDNSLNTVANEVSSQGVRVA
jgi:hypothetical protein